MTTPRQRRETLERCILTCSFNDRIRLAPVGQAIQQMPQDVRDVLKELTSDDIAHYRRDSIYV